VVLHGCETWSLTLREKRRLREFESREEVIRTDEEDVTRGRIKLRNEELHGLYSSPSIIRIIKSRMMRWA
jgi:hypothetical protein